VSSTVIYINPTGQRDNLGDSLLRRAYLQALRDCGQLSVLVTDGDDYSSALGLSEGDVIWTSRPRWYLNALVDVARRRGVFAVNAGEVVTGSGYSRRALWQLSLAVVANVRRQSVIMIGAGVRSAQSTAPVALRYLSRQASVLSWRDPSSRTSVGLGLVRPDWAFATGTPHRELPSLSARGLIAIALRGDHPYPSSEWIESVRAWCDLRGYEPRVVVQVRRDAELARRLGRDLNCEVVDWPGTRNHRDHEAVLRETYRHCVAVISDRIHVLIAGLTEGASPVASSTVSTQKAARVFAPVSRLPIAEMRKPEQEHARWDELVSARDELLHDLSSARAELERVSDEMRLALGAPRIGLTPAAGLP
jgi:polysaccharide pyruvyl transferase WcaK-like protein